MSIKFSITFSNQWYNLGKIKVGEISLIKFENDYPG